MNIDDLENKAKLSNQMQIVAAYNRADDETKKELLNQVERIDFSHSIKPLFDHL